MTFANANQSKGVSPRPSRLWFVPKTSNGNRIFIRVRSSGKSIINACGTCSKCSDSRFSNLVSVLWLRVVDGLPSQRVAGGACYSWKCHQVKGGMLINWRHHLMTSWARTYACLLLQSWWTVYATLLINLFNDQNASDMSTFNCGVVTETINLKVMIGCSLQDIHFYISVSGANLVADCIICVNDH